MLGLLGFDPITFQLLSSGGERSLEGTSCKPLVPWSCLESRNNEFEKTHGAYLNFNRQVSWGLARLNSESYWNRTVLPLIPLDLDQFRGNQQTPANRQARIAGSTSQSMFQTTMISSTSFAQITDHWPKNCAATTGHNPPHNVRTHMHHSENKIP